MVIKQQLSSHALGISFGHFAQEIGMISALNDQVNLKIKNDPFARSPVYPPSI